MRCAAPRLSHLARGITSRRAPRGRGCAAAAAPTGRLLCDDGQPLEGVDAVVLLAGGLTADNGLPPWVELRCDAAVAAHRATGVPILCSGFSTPHRPSNLRYASNGGGPRVLTEATVLAERLLAAGVPASSLLKESASADTLGNAWFGLMTHGLPAGWQRPLVVTSAFHMARSRAAFEWVWGLPAQSGVVWYTPRLQFLSTANSGLADEVVAARAGREAESLAALRGNAQQVRTLAAFHAWLNATHMCYAVARQEEWFQGPARQGGAATEAERASY